MFDGRPTPTEGEIKKRLADRELEDQLPNDERIQRAKLREEIYANWYEPRSYGMTAAETKTWQEARIEFLRKLTDLENKEMDSQRASLPAGRIEEFRLELEKLLKENS